MARYAHPMDDGIMAVVSAGLGSDRIDINPARQVANQPPQDDARLNKSSNCHDSVRVSRDLAGDPPVIGAVVTANVGYLACSTWSRKRM